MKRVLMAAVCLSVLCSIGSAQAACTGIMFTDVTAPPLSAAFCESIERFATLGITTGYPDGTYKPQNNVTRGQMAVFFMRAIDNVLQQKQGLAIVAPSNGDYTSPVDAMNDLVSWCRDADDSTTPCLVKILPGTYDVGTNTVQMQPYVDIEGSGENTTVIEGSLDSSTAGVVNGASSAEIRFLTIKNTGAGTHKVAMYNNAVSPKVTSVTTVATGSSTAAGTTARAFLNGGSTLTLTNVSAEASGASSNTAIANYNSPTPGMTMTNVNAKVEITAGDYAFGVYNSGAGSVIVMTNVTAVVSGGSAYTAAVYNHTASAAIHHVTATATATVNAFAVFSDGGDTCASCSVKIHDSVLKGSTGAFGELHGGHGLVTRIAGSQIDGALGPAANLKCAGVFDENYAFSASTCPP